MSRGRWRGEGRAQIWLPRVDDGQTAPQGSTRGRRCLGTPNTCALVLLSCAPWAAVSAHELNAMGNDAASPFVGMCRQRSIVARALASAEPKRFCGESHRDSLA